MSNDKLPSIEELGRSIEAVKKKVSGDDDNKDDEPVSAAGALKISIELIAGVAVGSLIGYYIDTWLNTLPIFFIICFFLGVAGSALNIYKMSK